MKTDNENLIEKCSHCGSTDKVTTEPCPFDEEIYQDSTPCTCCDECRRECALAI